MGGARSRHDREPEGCVEQLVESNWKDVCRVEECGVALTDEDLKLTGTDLCIQCFSAQELADFEEPEEEVPWGGPVGLLESNWLDPRPLDLPITDEAGTLIESETKTCIQCGAKHTEGLVKGTAIGERPFCTEACWLDYIDGQPSGISDWASGPAEQEKPSVRSEQEHALSGGAPPPRRGA